MISKAKLNDTNSKYYQLNIDNLSSYNEHFDIVFSMEVFYYLKHPQTTTTALTRLSLSLSWRTQREKTRGMWMREHMHAHQGGKPE